MVKLLSAFVVSALALLGAGITGRWTGAVTVERDGGARKSAALFIFKQDGAKVTGTVGRSAEDQVPIQSGRVEDGKIYLEVEPHDGPSKVLLELKLDGDDRMVGEAKGESDDGKFVAKIDVTREK